LFSATFSKEIKQLAGSFLTDPAEVQIAAQNSTAERIEQTVHLVEQKHKRELLSFMIGKNNWNQVLIFTRTKHGANRLATQLGKDGINAVAIHGNKSQGARTRALEEFKRGKVRALVATDIAARGLDIEQLPHVVNFELPHKPEDYVHRIGRTGRAGREGEAISLVCREETKQLRDIEKLLKRQLPQTINEGFEPEEPALSKVADIRQPNRNSGRGNGSSNSGNSSNRRGRSNSNNSSNSRNQSSGNRSDSRSDNRSESRGEKNGNRRGGQQASSQSGSSNRRRAPSRRAASA
jgi:ATP-dependent RNA helicase RhlE